jgi:hypothetical protein
MRVHDGVLGNRDSEGRDTAQGAHQLEGDGKGSRLIYTVRTKSARGRSHLPVEAIGAISRAYNPGNST